VRTTKIVKFFKQKLIFNLTNVIICSVVKIINFKENCAGRNGTVAEKSRVSVGRKVTLAEKGRVHFGRKR